MKQPKKMKPCLRYTAGELKQSRNADIVAGVAKLPDDYVVFCDPEQVGFEPGEPAKLEACDGDAADEN